MSEIVKLRTRADIDEEAAVWIWRMDSAAVAGADRQGYEAWLRQDPRHRRARGGALYGVERARWACGGQARREDCDFRPDRELPLLHHPRRWWFAAARRARRGRGRYDMAAARRRIADLGDGRRPATQCHVGGRLDRDPEYQHHRRTDLRRRTREIYLRKGEAHFQSRMTARGHSWYTPAMPWCGPSVPHSKFRVLTDQHVDVMVDEGRVEVQAPALPPASPSPGTNARARRAAATTVRALNAGERLSTASRDYAITPITAQQLSSELAWREGAIIFDGEPLSEAITEIERYTDARIVVSDPEIARLRVGGRFRTGDMQEFFDALQTALPVSIRHTDSGLVFIDPAAERNPTVAV